MHRPSRSNQRRASIHEKREFVYFTDPMCSWCYGFSPVITALAGRFETAPAPAHDHGRTTRTSSADQPFSWKIKQYIRDAWKRVEATTGQPFDMGFLAREHFVYDTEPASGR